MKIIEKLNARDKGQFTSPIPTIAFLGDSITHGCFETFNLGEGKGTMSDCDSKAVYHNLVKEALLELFPRCGVNIVNAGIGGDKTEGALGRIEKDVLNKNPDLVVIMFGVNDAFSGGVEHADIYKENLRKLFTMVQDAGSEVIFMTPPMMCTKVSHRLTDSMLRGVAEGAAKVQNEGVLTLYVEKAREVAKECGVPVAEVYDKWMKLHNSGVDVTSLMANYINHPSRNMHKLFAKAVLEAMFS